MSSKPVVVLRLPPEIARKMFRDADLARLGDFADVKGPFNGNEAGQASALARARALITGWGTPRIDETILKQAPQLGLIAHSAGTLRGLVDDAVFDRGIRVTTSAGANAVPVAQYTLAMSQGCKDMGELAIDETIRFLKGEGLQAELTLACPRANAMMRSWLRLFSMDLGVF